MWACGRLQSVPVRRSRSPTYLAGTPAPCGLARLAFRSPQADGATRRNADASQLEEGTVRRRSLAREDRRDEQEEREARHQDVVAAVGEQPPEWRGHQRRPRRAE